MKKNEFLQQLDMNLQELGVAPSVIEEQVNRVKAYLDEAAMEEINIDPAEMARGIIETLKSEDIENETADDETDEEPEADEAVAEADIDEVIADADIPEEETVETSDEQNAAEFAAIVGDTAETDEPEAPGIDDDLISAISVLNDAERRKRAAQEETVAEEATGAAVEPAYQDGDDTEYDDDSDMKIADTNDSGAKVIDDVSAGQDDYDEDIEKFLPPDSARLKESHRRQKAVAANNSDVYVSSANDEQDWAAKPEKTGGNAFFWTLFCILLPFAAILAVAIAVLYVLFWVALAALMIICIAGLIAFVAVGAVIALTGIVYGVVQLVKGLGLAPIGLFEIGLGITVGAIVLFVGILIYNFAIRLIPFAMKQLARLVGFTFRKGREAFIAAKGACERL